MSAFTVRSVLATNPEDLRAMPGVGTSTVALFVELQADLRARLFAHDAARFAPPRGLVAPAV